MCLSAPNHSFRTGPWVPSLLLSVRSVGADATENGPWTRKKSVPEINVSYSPVNAYLHERRRTYRGVSNVCVISETSDVSEDSEGLQVARTFAKPERVGSRSVEESRVP